MSDPVKRTDPTAKLRAMSVEKGTAYVMFAYDIAHSISLNEAEKRIQAGKQRETIRHRRRAPSYFEYSPPPLRIPQDARPLDLGPFRTNPSADVVLYDFGAVSVVYTVPLAGPFADLLLLSDQLYDNPMLLEDSRRRVEELLRVIGPAASKTSIAGFVEDYVIYHVEGFSPQVSGSHLIAGHATEIAGILRAERSRLSSQETADAVTARISFGPDDVTVVDWNAALVLDPQGDDTRTVLEFANVELLEMRYLDDCLDRALDQAYEMLSGRIWSRRRLFGSYSQELRQLSELQVHSAILFEQVNNTLKLFGDQYLARVYRMAFQRFHIGEWDTSIMRKLQTLESIYNKITDQAANWRIEVLEWIIIILIASEIVLLIYLEQ